MNQINVGTVNGVAITAFQKDEQFLVPIKPICTALGIDIEPQRKKIMEDEYIAPVAVLETATGADNRLYEMLCLPLFFIPGWLFSINPKNVAPEAKEKVRNFKWECYKVLYSHFFGSFIESSTMSEKARELRKEIADEESRLVTHQEEAKQIKSKISDLKIKLGDITEKMINPERHLFNS